MLSRRKLEKAGAELTDLLRKTVVGVSLRVRTNKVVETETGGWALTVATLGKDRLKIEIWYDKYLDNKSPVFWVGFYSDQTQLIDELVDQCPDILLPKIEIRESDKIETRGIRHLRKPVPSQIPIRETYAHCGCFGFYGDLSCSFDTTKSLMFIEGVVKALSEFTDAADEVFWENRKAFVLHLRSERNAKVASECKKRDDYRCQICSMKFDEVYGSIGKDFAEAHHKNWLSHNKNEIAVTKHDLITVCSNCHKMLHKLEGDIGDIDRLRAILDQTAKLKVSN